MERGSMINGIKSVIEARGVVLLPVPPTIYRSGQ